MVAEIEEVTWWDMKHYGYQPQTPLAQLLPVALAKTFQRRYRNLYRRTGIKLLK